MISPRTCRPVARTQLPADVHELFHVLDADENGYLDYQEIVSTTINIDRASPALAVGTGDDCPQGDRTSPAAQECSSVRSFQFIDCVSFTQWSSGRG
jgi:hypothetical protein